MRGKSKISTPASKLRAHVLDVLKDEGYIRGYATIEKDGSKPEIDYDKAETIWGMDIIVCTTARSDDEARALLREMQFPFRKN